MLNDLPRGVPRYLGLIILALNCLLPAAIVSAQRCIEGTLVDAVKGENIPGAYVRFGDKQVMLSDAKGHFRACTPNSDSIYLEINHLTFKKHAAYYPVYKDRPNYVTIQLEESSLMVGEVVITATRTENRLTETPVRAHVLTATQLESGAHQKIDESLQMLPGITINRSFGFIGAKSTVSMRGLNGKEQGRVLVLMDGVPLNKSDGGSVDWNMIDLENIEKIEVTKGAGSAVYGGNAMGGIINLFSQVPGEGWKSSLSLEYGSFNTLGARLSAGNKHRLKNKQSHVYWLLNTFYKESDGYITQSEADQQMNPYIVKSGMQEAGARLKTGLSFNARHKLEATFNVYDDNRGGGETVFQPEGNTTDHDSRGATLLYQGRLDKLNLHSQAYFLQEDYKKVNEYLKDDYTWYDVLSVRRDAGLTTTAHQQLGTHHRITAGFELKQGSVDAADSYYTSTDIVYNKGEILTSALFIQDEMAYLQGRLRFIAGLRHDHAAFSRGAFYIEKPTKETSFMKEYQVPDMPKQQWNALSPRLSVQYSPREERRVYLVYSRGFRTAVLDELCRSGRVKGGFKIANPGLKPEYLDNFESGFDHILFKKLKINASVYYSRGRDFQYYVTNGQSIDMGFGERPIMIRANISQIKVLGMEAEARFNSQGKFQFFANYGYSHSTISNYQKLSGQDTIDLSGKFLTDVPAHLAGAGCSILHKLVNASLSVRYTGSAWINDQNSFDEVLLLDKYPAYTTLDLKFWKKWMGKFTTSLSLQNLLDEKYYDSKYAVNPGRVIMFEIKYQLK